MRTRFKKSSALTLAVILSLGVVIVAGACTDRRAPEASPTPTGRTPTPTIAATATPTPQKTPALTPTPLLPTIVPTLESPSKVGEAALEHMRHLAEKIGPRASATNGELEAARYIEQQLLGYGYLVKLQPFTVLAFSTDLTISQVVSPIEDALEANILVGSGEDEVQGQVHHAGLGRREDFPIGGLQGGVTLIERGTLLFQDKVSNAVEAGASAVIIYNNREGNFRGTLGKPSPVPAVSISAADGERLLALMEEGEVLIRVRVVREDHPSRNVVATGEVRDSGILVFGAHYDTVPGVPGANDNATGTSALLVLAEQLAERALPFEVRFIAFGSEETGLEGSRYYVSHLPPEELNRVVSMINLDAIGSGTLNIVGDEELVEKALLIAEEQGTLAREAALPMGASSDHASFSAEGVRVIAFSGSDFSMIHTPRDRLELVDFELLEDAIGVALALVEELASETPRFGSLEFIQPVWAYGSLRSQSGRT